MSCCSCIVSRLLFILGRKGDRLVNSWNFQGTLSYIYEDQKVLFRVPKLGVSRLRPPRRSKSWPRPNHHVNLLVWAWNPYQMNPVKVEPQTWYPKLAIYLQLNSWFSAVQPQSAENHYLTWELHFLLSFYLFYLSAAPDLISWFSAEISWNL